MVNESRQQLTEQCRAVMDGRKNLLEQFERKRSRLTKTQLRKLRAQQINQVAEETNLVAVAKNIIEKRDSATRACLFALDRLYMLVGEYEHLRCLSRMDVMETVLPSWEESSVAAAELTIALQAGSYDNFLENAIEQQTKAGYFGRPLPEIWEHIKDRR